KNRPTKRPFPRGRAALRRLFAQSSSTHGTSDRRPPQHATWRVPPASRIAVASAPDLLTHRAYPAGRASALERGPDARPVSRWADSVDAAENQRRLGRALAAYSPCWRTDLVPQTSAKSYDR